MTTRAECPDCGRMVQVRLDGALRLHKAAGGVACDGGGVNHAERDREWARLDRAAVDCEAIGVAHLWDVISADATPSGRMLRDMLAAFARCLLESGAILAADPEDAAA